MHPILDITLDQTDAWALQQNPTQHIRGAGRDLVLQQNKLPHPRLVMQKLTGENRLLASVTSTTLLYHQSELAIPYDLSLRFKPADGYHKHILTAQSLT